MLVERDLEWYKKANSILKEILRETNLRLEEKIDEFSLFRIVADTVNRIVSEDNSLKYLLSKMIDIVGASNSSIMLMDEESETLKIEAASGTQDDLSTNPTFRLGEGIAGWVAQEKKSVSLGDVRQSNQFLAEKSERGNIQSLICLPLIFEDKILGVLNVSSDRSNAFSLNTERTLMIIAGQVAIALNNTRTWREQKTREKVLEEQNQELLRIKQKLEETQEQLLKSQKLEVIKEMATSMHHEINNPLTTIYSCTRLLESSITDVSDSTQQTLEKIKESCKQITDIVYKLSHLQNVVMTDYVAEHKMIDVERSFTEKNQS